MIFRTIFHIALMIVDLSLNVNNVLQKDNKKPVAKPGAKYMINGFVVKIEEVPYQAQLKIFVTPFSDVLCGGSIISESWIITAAHCVENLIPLTSRVYVGSSIIDMGEGFRIRKVRQHPKFNIESKVFDYDFALIKIWGQITFDATKQPIQLPAQNETVKAGTMCKMTGWGITENNKRSYRIRALDVPTVKRETCEERVGKYYFTDRMLCAGLFDGFRDSCYGDSGGPLVTSDNKLIGIISWGRGCAHPAMPTVFSKVASVRDWIKEVSGV